MPHALAGGLAKAFSILVFVHEFEASSATSQNFTSLVVARTVCQGRYLYMVSLYLPCPSWAPGLVPGPRSRRNGTCPLAVNSKANAPTTIIEINHAKGTNRAVTLGTLQPEQVQAQALALPTADPVAAIRAFFLPPGFPDSVSPDYLRYQLYTFPSHVLGWMSHCKHA